MIAEIERLVQEYAAWLKDKTVLRQVSDVVEITTPYLDRHNDYLQIYAKKDNGGFLLTDDAYILEDLEQSGCTLSSKRRQDLLKITLNGFGIQLDGRALVTHANSSNFAMKKHNLIQAMLAINDLFYLATPIVASIFLEDVSSWMDLNQIRYTPRVKFTGKSGYDHSFDFVIPKSSQSPERMIRAITKPNKDTAQLLVFAWTDTKEVRAPEAKAFAFLNDAEQSPSPSIIDALKNYDVHPIIWSERERAIKELAA